MVDQPWDNNRASTNWAWRKVKIPEAHPARGARAAASSSKPLGRRYQTEAFTIVLRYRGGAESSWLVRRGGKYWRIPGWLCFDDAMRRVAEVDLPWERR